MKVFSVQCSVFSPVDQRDVVRVAATRSGARERAPLRVAAARLLGCGTILLLLLPAIGFAQPANVVDEAKEARRKRILEGSEAFRRILFDHNLEPLDDFADLEVEPEKKILIVQGNLDVLDKVPQSLVQFVREGGAVLIASDRQARSRKAREQLSTLAGVSIYPKKLRCVEQESCYMGLPYCPFVSPSQKTEPALFFDTDTGQSRGVATNVPSCLVVERRVRGVRAIAWLPAGCRFDDEDDAIQGRRNELLFAVAGDLGKGRVLAMADHSVFINEMMIPRDTGNFDFTSNAVVWLRGEETQRTKVLFVDERGIQTKFEIPLKSLNISPEEVARLIFDKRNEILVAGNNFIVRLEDQGSFDNGVLNLFNRAGLPPARLALFAFVALTILAGLYGIYRVGNRGRFHHDLTAPMLATTLDRNLPVAALAEQRHLTMLASGNLTEPAMHLARQWFVGIGVVRFDGQMPKLDADGGWWRRRRLAARLREVWTVAAGQGGRITAVRLKAFESTLSELRAAHARGEWRF